MMLGHLITKRFEFRRSQEWGNIAVPVGGSEAAPLYNEYMHVYLEKIVADLKRLGVWDSSSWNCTRGCRKKRRREGGRKRERIERKSSGVQVRLRVSVCVCVRVCVRGALGSYGVQALVC